MSGQDPLSECLQGRVAPELAIARLLLRGDDPAAIRQAVQRAQTAVDTWTELSRLVQSGTLVRLRRMIDTAGMDHAEAASPAHIAAMFDRAVAVSPEGSVALYSLGEADRLHAATAEIVAWLSNAALLGPDRDVLDLGCGIGRIAAAIAGDVRSVHGIDVAPGMIAEARRRCGELSNVSFAVTDGHGLEPFPQHSFDLILAVDCFPYLVQAAVAENHVADAARVLRAGGVLIVLNLSYRGDDLADRAEAENWARKFGLFLDPCGAAPFRLWDARAYGFRTAGTVDRDPAAA